MEKENDSVNEVEGMRRKVVLVEPEILRQVIQRQRARKLGVSDVGHVWQARTWDRKG